MRWLMNKLGYVSIAEAHAMIDRYKELVNNELSCIVEKHNMQGAWEQMKQERKQARLH